MKYFVDVFYKGCKIDTIEKDRRSRKQAKEATLVDVFYHLEVREVNEESKDAE